MDAGMVPGHCFVGGLVLLTHWVRAGRNPMSGSHGDWDPIWETEQWKNASASLRGVSGEMAGGTRWRRRWCPRSALDPQPCSRVCLDPIDK